MEENPNPYQSPDSLVAERGPVRLWRKIACYVILFAATVPGCFFGVCLYVLVVERSPRPGAKPILAIVTFALAVVTGAMVWLGVRLRR